MGLCTLQHRVLRGQGRIDPRLDQALDLGAPVAGQSLGLGAVRHRFRQGRGRRRGGQDAILLTDRLGQDEIGRHDAQRILLLQPIRLGGQDVGEGVDPRHIGVGVGGGFDGVLIGQEVRRGLIGAALLADPIRIGPAALAIGDVIGRDDPVQIILDAVVIVQIAGRQSAPVDAAQVGGLLANEGALVLFLDAGRGCQLRLGGGARALVQAEHGHDLGRAVQRALERLVHEALEGAVHASGGIAILRAGRGRRASDGAPDGVKPGAQRGGLKKAATIQHDVLPTDDAAMETARADAASEIAASGVGRAKKKARRIVPPGLLSVFVTASH